MNTVHLMGYLSRDIELRYAQSGTAIGNTAIAVNRRWTDSSTGEKKEEVSFVDLTFFGKQAETAAEYLKKGSPVVIVGRLKQDTWDDKTTGKPQSKLGVIVESMHFVPRGKDDAQESAPRGKVPVRGKPAPKIDAETVAEVAAGFDRNEDDVPF